MTTRARRGRPPHDDVLTPAEWRIVHAITHGMTSREIADRRRISVDAVKFHVANVLKKLELPNRKALRQWFRVPKGSALSRRHTTSDAPSALGRIGQISRTVRNLQESRQWYQEVVGLPHLYTFGNLAFFDCAGTRLLLTAQGAASPTESILYLLVDDIVKTYEHLRSRVEFTNAPHLIHRHANGAEEWMAFFKDPEGRPLAIMSRVQP
jgi:DNA-binding CsgD family transcriptional regulator/catechol 2,3-dioxygenase-like lactoylglutathione lyase family enzyme